MRLCPGSLQPVGTRVGPNESVVCPACWTSHCTIERPYPVTVLPQFQDIPVLERVIESHPAPSNCFEGHYFEARYENQYDPLGHVVLQKYLGDRCTRCGEWAQEQGEVRK